MIREKTLNLFGPILEDQTMLNSLINCQKEVERNKIILEVRVILLYQEIVVPYNFHTIDLNFDLLALKCMECREMFSKNYPRKAQN